MIEREKCGPEMKAALANSGIFYCYIDDFYTGNEENLKTTALFNEIYRTVKPHLSFNAIELFEAALRSTRIKMSPAAKRQFFEKHIQQMKLVIDDDGNVTVELNQK